MKTIPTTQWGQDLNAVLQKEAVDSVVNDLNKLCRICEKIGKTMTKYGLWKDPRILDATDQWAQDVNAVLEQFKQAEEEWNADHNDVSLR